MFLKKREFPDVEVDFPVLGDGSSTSPALISFKECHVSRPLCMTQFGNSPLNRALSCGGPSLLS